MSWELYALAAVCTILFAVLVERYRGIRREHERAAQQGAVLEASPFGLLQWAETGWIANRSARALLSLNNEELPLTSADVAASLQEDSIETLREALDTLTSDGTVFELTLETIERNSLALYGSGSKDNAIVWIRDDTASAWLAERFTHLEAETVLLEGILNAAPVPIWWRDADTLEIAGRNEAYTDLVGGGTAGDIPELSSGQHKGALAKLAVRTGAPQSESRHFVQGGTRRALSVTEGPVPGRPDRIVGSAQDLTALEDLQISLAEHIAVQDQVLEMLTSAIAIFGPDKRLKFYNSPYSQMWYVSEKLLNEQPTQSTLLEVLREGQQLPEMSDFPAYKRSMDQLFTSLIDPSEELLHLPDGRTIRTVRSPHPLGGLIFQYEDVTDRLALESSFNTLTAVQSSTLNSLLEGVCVFGRDGRMKLFNNVYASMFGYDPDWLATAPHISDVIDKGGSQLHLKGDWDGLKAHLIRSVAEPRSKSGDMRLTDGRIIRYAYIPLPDGQCLVLYMDITDTTQVENALRERNRALENADLLKSRFISNVSYELRTPLNAILGFAELLKIGVSESLADRRETYIDGIHSAGITLSDIIEDMLDLAVVQAGFIALEHEAIDLEEMMLDVVHECAQQDAAEQQILSPIEISGDPPSAKAYADRSQLRKSLIRLLTAATGITLPDQPVNIIWAPEHADDETVAFRIEPQTDEKSLLEWADLVLGSPADQFGSNAMLDSAPRAESADLTIRLARSLIYAQQGELVPGDAPGSVVCCLPTAKP